VSSPREKTRRSRILIATGEEALADAYEGHLERDHETEVALDAETALETVDGSFDIVLIEHQLPDRSGLEVFEEIRRRGLDCRVVMVMAENVEVDIAEMEFDDYVVKPVDPEKLRDVVDRSLTIAEYNEQLKELNSLKLKRNVLEVELATPELEKSDEYQRLVDSIESLEESLARMEEELDLDQVDLHL